MLDVALSAGNISMNKITLHETRVLMGQSDSK